MVSGQHSLAPLDPDCLDGFQCNALAFGIGAPQNSGIHARHSVVVDNEDVKELCFILPEYFGLFYMQIGGRVEGFTKIVLTTKRSSVCVCVCVCVCAHASQLHLGSADQGGMCFNNQFVHVKECYSNVVLLFKFPSHRITEGSLCVSKRVVSMLC